MRQVDHRDNLKYIKEYHTYRKDMAYLLSPSETLYSVSASSQPVPALNNIEGYLCNGKQLAVFNHKKLTLYTHQTQTNENNQSSREVLATAEFSKKVEVMTFAGDDLIVSDKYGDIFRVSKSEKTFLNENFCIPTLIQYVETPEYKVIVVGDQYSKLKVLNLERPHEILSIWTPFEAIPLQLVRINNTLVYLARVHKKDNVEVKYEIYTLDVSSLKEETFPGKLQAWFQSEFSDTHLCRLVVTQTSIYVVSIHPNTLKVQVFTEGLELKKEVVSEIGKEEWNSLDIAYLGGLYVFFGKENGSEPAKELPLPVEFKLVSSSAKESLVFIDV